MEAFVHVEILMCFHSVATLSYHFQLLQPLGSPFFTKLNLLTLACAHAQRRVIAVGLSVRVCVCVCPSVRLSTVFLGNRGNSERETWTYYQVGGMHGKIRFWSGEGRGSW